MRKRQYRTQAGVTLLELLIGLFLATMVLGLIYGAFEMYQKFRIKLESKNNLYLNTEILREVITHDIANSCSGLNEISLNTLSVKDVSANKPQPAIFLSEHGDSLTIIKTNSHGYGEIEISNGLKFVISGGLRDTWLKLGTNDLVFVFDGLATPAFCRLTSKPRMATLADLQGQTTAFLWPDRTIVIELSPATCFGISSLTASIPTRGRVFAVNQVVRYEIKPDAIVRREITNCGSSAPIPTQDFGMGYDFSQIRFQYMTAGGVSSALPADPTMITGVRLFGKTVDPTTKLAEDINYEVAIDAWRYRE